MTQYQCPTCSRVVWHECESRIYRRKLSREYSLPALRVIELEPSPYPSPEEAWHNGYRNVDDDYQSPTIAEARRETGDSGRRKEGTGYK